LYETQDYFATTIGPIRKILLYYGPNGQSRGSAEITFVHPDSAAKAVAELDKVKVDKRPIKVRHTLVQHLNTLLTGLRLKSSSMLKVPPPLLQRRRWATASVNPRARRLSPSLQLLQRMSARRLVVVAVVSVAAVAVAARTRVVSPNQQKNSIKRWQTTGRAVLMELIQPWRQTVVLSSQLPPMAILEWRMRLW
jgi:RNA recognition motif-containing protein